MYIKVGRRTIDISHPDKLLFPISNITKVELVEYYASIAEIMYPYAQDRLISMHRFPEGIGAEGFYQKDAPDYFPDWITRVSVAKQDGGHVDYVCADNKATVTYLSTQGVITPHFWLSKIDKLEYPDRMIFDLDPSTHNFNQIRRIALAFRELLTEYELPSYVMTTGSRGLHVVVPLKRTETFDDVRACAKALADQMVQLQPQLTTTEIRKDKRGTKIFIDYLRNAFSATSVAPYAVRAKEGAPVATPISWDEVADRSLKSTRYTIKNIFQKLEQEDDPWHGMMRKARSLNATILSVSRGITE